MNEDGERNDLCERNLDLPPTTILLNIIAPDNVNRMLSHVNIKEIWILSVFGLQLIPLQEELVEVTGPNVQKVNNGIITMAGNIVGHNRKEKVEYRRGISLPTNLIALQDSCKISTQCSALIHRALKVWPKKLSVTRIFHSFSICAVCSWFAFVDVSGGIWRRKNYLAPKICKQSIIYHSKLCIC